MELIGSIIEKLLSETGVTAVTNPLGNWKDIVGEQVSLKARPVKLKNGVLTVHVYDSVWKHYLDLNKEEIIQKINARSSGEPVKKIVFKVGELPETYESGVIKPKKRPRKRKRSKPKKYELSSEAKNFIKACRDPELKKIAKKLLPLFEPETSSKNSNHE